MAEFIPNTLDTTVLNTTLADYSKTLVDNVYNSNEVLRILSENKQKVDGGGSLVDILMKDRQNAGGFYLGADVLNNSVPHVLTQCENKWQNLYEPVQITRDEERQNSGLAHKLIDLIQVKMVSSEKAIGERLEQAVSTPVAGAGNLNDLETIVNTGALGSLNGATDTFWQSTVTSSGAFAAQGLTDMATATFAVGASASKDTPNLYLTNKTIYQKYWQTRLPLERITNGAASANAGASTLTFMGEKITYGNFIGSGLLFGLNTNYLKLKVDSATDMVTTDFSVPSNQTVKVAYILWRGNLTTNNRRRLFKLTDIT